jgi:hypothetical protein
MILSEKKGGKMDKTEIVRNAIKKFQHLPNRTIARYILHNYGVFFDGDLEKIRSAVRYQLGQYGKDARKSIGNRVIEKGPVFLPKTWRETRTPHKLQPGTWLVMSDLHIPFHEPKPIESTIKFAKDKKVTGILFNGDLQDCHSISFWPSALKRDFDKEVESVIDFLDFIEQEFPDTAKVYKPGNHEYRLPRYYQSKAPELIGLPLLAFDTVLGLEYRGIEFLQYKQKVMAGKLPILHGDEFRTLSRAVNPARGLFLKTKSWAACSHCHTTSQDTHTDIHDNILTTWSFGCLCDLSPDYNPYANDWNWGFAIINVEPNGNFEVENKRILRNGKVV